MNTNLLKAMGVTFGIMFVWYLLYNRLDQLFFAVLTPENTFLYALLAAVWMAGGFVICGYFVWSLAYNHNYGWYHLLFVGVVTALTIIAYVV